MSHLGDVAAALVDGELGHAARERALRHLADCVPCRLEVASQRSLKASMTATRACPPDLGDALTSRLLALPAAGDGGHLPGTVDSRASRSSWSTAVAAESRPHLFAGRRRRTAVGAGALVLGTAVLVLGVPRPGPAVPVEPAGGGGPVTQLVRTDTGAPELSDTRPGTPQR